MWDLFMLALWINVLICRWMSNETQSARMSSLKFPAEQNLHNLGLWIRLFYALVYSCPH